MSVADFYSPDMTFAWSAAGQSHQRPNADTGLTAVLFSVARFDAAPQPVDNRYLRQRRFSAKHEGRLPELSSAIIRAWAVFRPSESP
jgi:hypothetical protein